MRTTWLLPMLALACSPSEGDDTTSPPPGTTPTDPTTETPTADTGTPGTTDTGTEPEEPVPYIIDEEEAPDVEVDLDRVGETLQDVLDMALSLNAVPVQASYDQAMEGQGGQCPYYYTTPQGTYWFDNCTSEHGSTFNGYVFAYGESDVPEPYSGGVMSYWSASGAATVVDAEDHLLEVGGSAYHQSTVAPGYTTFTSVVAGTFTWDGGEAVDTWLGDGLDPDFTLYGYVTTGPVGGGRLMYLDGGFGGIEGGWAVAFDENQIAQASLGVDCATELSGTVGVRTPEGQWVDIVFDGNPEGAVPAASCDGCGVGFVQGEVVGDVCVDATSVLDWEQSPW